MNKHPIYYLCRFCSKFISFVDMATAICYTPFGNSIMSEPSDEKYAHRQCWDAAGDDTKDLILRTAWIINITNPYAESRN